MLRSPTGASELAPIRTFIRLRPRLLVSAIIASAALLFLPDAWPLTSRILFAWDTGAILYLGMAWRLMAVSTVKAVRQRARQEDEGAAVILCLTALAALASLGAIGMELSGLRFGGNAGQTTRLGLAGVTIFCSWVLLHTIFAIHYAHEFYSDRHGAGGLGFPGELEPEYWDFMYFAFTIGSAAQTSDVTVVSRRMRRVVLAHTVVSFLFNTTILALVINIAAGLL